MRGARHPAPRSGLGPVGAWPRSTSCSPDRVLIEGPPTPTPLLALVADPDLVPAGGAAGLRAPTTRGAAAFWPFAVFSPEWQALTLGAPATRSRCGSATCRRRRSLAAPTPADRTTGAESSRTADGTSAARARPTRSPLLAEAAGYDDPERWWDDVIESRRDGRRRSTRVDRRDDRGRGPQPPRRPTDAAHRPPRGAHAAGAAGRAEGRARGGSPSSAAPGTPRR